MRYEVRAPLPGFTGNVVGIDFVDGIGEFDDNNDAGRSARAYFERAGYRMDQVGETTPDQAPPSQTPPADEFDPAEHKADEVMAYLDTASYEDAVRVLDAEAADGGKQRVTITGKRDEILAAKTPATPPQGDDTTKGAEQ